MHPWTPEMQVGWDVEAPLCLKIKEEKLNIIIIITFIYGVSHRLFQHKWGDRPSVLTLAIFASKL